MRPFSIRHLSLMLRTLMLLNSLSAAAQAMSFSAHELFRIPFGKSAEMLGSQADGPNFLFPRDFTIDGDGHFYIYDSTRHRVVRYSFYGKYEMEFRYPATAQQVFAHPDSHKNLWLLVSDPGRGMFYGVYNEHGKLLRSGIFARFTNFRLHVDDDYALHILLSAPGTAEKAQSFVFDEHRLLMTKEDRVRPPDTHHEAHKDARKYFIDQMPDASADDAQHRNRITDDSRRPIAEIKGTVLYVTERGDVYTRVGPRDIAVYDLDGGRKATLRLQGLRSACATLRFDSDGNIYELDGIPADAPPSHSAGAPAPEDSRYSAAMPGMRIIKWQRE